MHVQACLVHSVKNGTIKHFSPIRTGRTVYILASSMVLFQIFVKLFFYNGNKFHKLPLAKENSHNHAIFPALFLTKIATLPYFQKKGGDGMDPIEDVKLRVF